MSFLKNALHAILRLNDDEKQFRINIDTDQELNIYTILTTIKSELKQW